MDFERRIKLAQNFHKLLKIGYYGGNKLIKFEDLVIRIKIYFDVNDPVEIFLCIKELENCNCILKYNVEYYKVT